MIPKPMMSHYISLLLKHRRLVLSGPSGTGKTYLAQRLAHYLLQRSRTDLSEADHETCLLGSSAAVTFNMHRQSQKVAPYSGLFDVILLSFFVNKCGFVLTGNVNVLSLLSQELQLYLSELANQIDRETVGELPLVVIIDDISDPASLTELVNGALTCKYHKW